MPHHPLPSLDPRALIAVAVALGLSACAVAPADGGAASRRPTSVATAAASRHDQRAAPVSAAGVRGLEEIDPSVLLPSADTSDDQVAVVGGFSVHKRHVYEHLGKTEPAAQRTLVESVVLDVLVAQAAKAWDIRLRAWIWAWPQKCSK